MLVRMFIRLVGNECAEIPTGITDVPKTLETRPGVVIGEQKPGIVQHLLDSPFARHVIGTDRIPSGIPEALSGCPFADQCVAEVPERL
jgi:hypothetical protein